MKIDVFLASLMRPNPDLSDRLKRAGVTEEQLRVVTEEAKAAGLLSGHSLDPTAAETFFGAPMEKNSEHWRYELVLWPEHYFDLGLTESGRLLNKGFALRSPDLRLPASIPLEYESVERVLRPGFHTQSEVKRLLGAPAESQGWNALEDWFYGPVRGDQFVVVELDFGLLATVSQRPLISLPHSTV